MELGETPPELVDLQERILMGGLEAVAGTSAVDGGEVEKRAGKRGREVMAKPSGNNSFTFFMPEEEEDEFDGGGDEEEEDMELDAVQSVGRAPGDKAREYDDAEPGEDLPRERQLTQKFLAGQLSFKDLMQVPAIIRGVFFILVRLKMTKVPGPEEILTLRTFLMGFIM